MSARFTRRAKALTLGGLATLGLAVVAQLAVTPEAFSAQDPGPIPSPYTVAINPGNLGVTATDEGCSQDDMSDVPSDRDGWLFVASPDDFVTFTAVFSTGTVTLADQSDTDATKWFSKEFEHLVVSTPAGATLTAAYATLSGDREFFVLSHTCAASVQETESPSPSPSESVSVSESPSESPSETASPEVSETQVVTESPSESPSEVVTESPSETASPEVSETQVVTESPSPEVSETETETASPTQSAEVLPTEITKSATPSATVEGTKVVRPVVGPTRLPSTGTPFPVLTLVLLGIGLMAAGVVTTVAGEPRAAGTTPRHRR